MVCPVVGRGIRLIGLCRPITRHPTTLVTMATRALKRCGRTVPGHSSPNCQPSPRDRFAEANQLILNTANYEKLVSQNHPTQRPHVDRPREARRLGRPGEHASLGGHHGRHRRTPHRRHGDRESPPNRPTTPIVSPHRRRPRRVSQPQGRPSRPKNRRPRQPRIPLG